MMSTLPKDINPARLERYGKGKKFAWYCRTDDLFSRLHTRRWLAPGDTADNGTHCVEIFGGGSPRQFGSFGPHTVERGKALVVYRWTEETPEDVPLHALDILTKDQLFKMLDAAEAELKRQGFTPVPRTKRGESAAGRAYDLEEGMLFDLAEGRTVTLAELGQMVKDGYTGRCSASWLEGPSAANPQRCLITRSGNGHLVVWETSEGISHMPAAIKPTDFTPQVDRVAEKLREKADARRSKLVKGDDHVSAAAKLLISYAFMPSANRPVLPLWSYTGNKSATLMNFRARMQAYCGVEVGPRGGEKKINPVDVWLSDPDRIVVQGERMRPDRERPVFKEHGRQWLNTYRPPDLGAADGGVADVGVALIEQLLPDKRERAWFRQWLAFKWKYPHIPGPAIIMVARDFGTGRSTFGAFLKLLFGDRYVVNVQFKIFAGLNYQSQYNDWALDALFAIVNESSATGGMSTYRAKHDVYEHLKEFVDPRPLERTFIRKSEGSIRAVSSASTLIMTNNPDCIPLPEDDRRFAVLTNGRQRDPEFWKFINDWMMKPANIAAFAQWLEETDIGDYSPYAPPPRTFAKSEMSEYNKTSLDDLVDAALTEMDGFFVPEQALKRMSEMEMSRRLELPSNWKAIATKEIRRKAFVVRYDNGQKLAPMFGGKRYHVMHMDRDVADKFGRGGARELRELLGRNGDVFNVTGSAVKTKLAAHLKAVKDG